MRFKDKILSLLKSGFDRLGIDARVGSGLGVRFAQMAMSPISSVITVWTLSVDNQGLFYLFGSLVALRAFFELGAGTSILQVAAHARKTNGMDSPLDPAFVATVNRWMRNVSAIFAAVAGISGALFLAYQGHGDVYTQLAWGGYLLVSSFQFYTEGRWGLVSGADLIQEANKLRLKNSFVQYGVLWLGLLAGAGLFAFCIAGFAACISQEWYFRTRYKWLYVHLSTQAAERLSHFRDQLITLIKRASQTYLTGYFVFQLQQPICFHFLGAADSARLGFTQSVGMALIGLPSVWLAMNFPRIAHQVADGKSQEAWILFRSRWVLTLVLSSLAALVAWLVCQGLGLVPRFATRLMDPGAAAILFSSLAIQTTALGLTYWPRAFKVEPFVFVAYMQMVATPLLLWWLVSHYGLVGVSFALLGSWLLGLTGIAFIVYQYLPKREVI